MKKLSSLICLSLLTVLCITLSPGSASARGYRIKLKVVGDCSYAFNHRGEPIADIRDGTDCVFKAIIRKVVKRRGRRRRVFVKNAVVYFGGFHYWERGMIRKQVGITNSRGAVQFYVDWANELCWYEASLSKNFDMLSDDITVRNSSDHFCKCGCV